MTDNHVWLRQIVADNATLFERINGNYISQETPPDLIEKRLEAWKQAVGKGETSKLIQRLKLVNLSLDDVQPLLGNMALPDDAGLPSWALALDAMLDVAETTDLSYLDADQVHDGRFIKADSPAPFEDFFAPFITVARTQFWDALPAEMENCLEDTAKAAIERLLLNSIGRTFVPSLMLEFKVFRVQRNPMWAFGQPKPDGTPTRDTYKDFIRYMLHDNLRAFFGNYPVLGRLLMASVDRWQQALQETLSQFITDLPTMQTTFGIQTKTIKDFRFGLSDPHNGGKMAMILTLSDDTKLVYKPHSLGLELAYQKLVVFLNDSDMSLKMKTMAVLSYDDHGWVEFIPHQGCTTPDEVARFYERFGMLIGIMYFLNGTDYHQENIIVSGEYPVPIDMEMLLHPKLSQELMDELDSFAINLSLPEVNVSSIFQSGMLPFGRIREGDFESAFISNIAPRQRQSVRPKWVHLNTDYMAVEQHTFEINLSERQHVLLLNGEPQPALDFIPRIVSGFETMYQHILVHRDALLDEDSPLYDFAELPSRFVLRATRIYGKILNASLEPANTRNAIDRSLYFEHLARAFAYESEFVDIPRFWVMFQDEVESLTNLDIPLIYMLTTSTDIETSEGHTIPNVFVSSGYNRLFETLHAMNENDLLRQVDLLQMVLYAATPIGDYRHRKPPVPLPNTNRLSRDEMLAEALRLGKQVRDLALISNNNPNWIQLDLKSDRTSRVATFADDELYNGLSGIALFMNAIWQYTGDQQYKDIVKAIVYGIHRRIEFQIKNNPEERQYGLGIGGVNSIAYSFLHIAATWQSETELLLETADNIVGLMTPERIATDMVFDIMGGVAGGILLLLPLYQQTQSPDLLNTLEHFGNHLLDNRTESLYDGLRSWKTLDSNHLTGFSHGAAGIAFALSQLYQLTEHQPYLDAAQEALAYEQKTFNDSVMNWPDLRNEHTFSNAWCHGAPGIALGRALMLNTLPDDSTIYDAMIHGLVSTRANVENPNETLVDHLCCGNVGRAEILWTIGHQQGRDDLLHDANTLMSHVIHRSRQNGGYKIFPNLPRDLKVCGLFQGLSGIGYTLLRFATHEQDYHLPNVLMVEPLVPVSK